MVFPSGRRFGGAGLRRGVRTPQGSPPEILPWTGVDESNLVLALDASIEMPDVGQGVNPWFDQSAQENDVPQSTTSKQPLRQTIGGKDAVAFDGTDDELELASGMTGWSASDPCTLYIATRIGGLSVWRACVAFSANGTSDPLMLFLNGSTNNFTFRAGGSDFATSAGDTNWHVFTIRKDGSSREAWIDGVSVGSSTAGTAHPAFDRVRIAQFYSTSGRWNGDYRSVIAYTSAHDTSTRELVEGRLMSRWGI